jgi:hypothetical protein
LVQDICSGGKSAEDRRDLAITGSCKDPDKDCETNVESFYRGEIAQKIDAFSKKYGGFISGEDLATYSPNGQGLVALLAGEPFRGGTVIWQRRIRMATWFLPFKAIIWVSVRDWLFPGRESVYRTGATVFH